MQGSAGGRLFVVVRNLHQRVKAEALGLARRCFLMPSFIHGQYDLRAPFPIQRFRPAGVVVAGAAATAVAPFPHSAGFCCPPATDECVVIFFVAVILAAEQGTRCPALYLRRRPLRACQADPGLSITITRAVLLRGAQNKTGTAGVSECTPSSTTRSPTTLLLPCEQGQSSVPAGGAAGKPNNGPFGRRAKVRWSAGRYNVESESFPPYFTQKGHENNRLSVTGLNRKRRRGCQSRGWTRSAELHHTEWGG